MTKRTTQAGGAPFAHLLGRNKAAAAGTGKAAETDDDDEKKKSKKAEETGGMDDAEDNEGDKKDKLDDIADDHTDDDGMSDTDDSDDTAAKKGTKAKGKAKAGDDEDDEKPSKDAAKAARLAERARCAAIFSSPYAAGQPHVAAQLAFQTNMSSKEAIGVLQATASDRPAQEASTAAPRKEAKGGGLRERMAGTDNPDVGADTGVQAPSSFAAKVLQADKVRRGLA